MADDDRKLPVNRKANLPAHTPDAAAPRGKTTIGYFIGGVRSVVRTKALGKVNDEQIEQIKYAELKGQLAKTMMDAEVEIARYIHDRDDVIADKREETAHDRATKRHTRKMERAQWDYDDQIAVQKNEAALYEARHTANAQRVGHDAFLASSSYRLERVIENAKQGKFDAELDALIVETERNKQVADVNHAGKAETAPSASAITRELLVLLNREIDLARQTGGADLELSRLYALRARLTASLDEK